jgi:hypothetical protein
VRFAGREREPNRKAAAINHHMYLAGETPPASHASPALANEVIVASGIRAELLRQIAPRCARSQDQKMPFRTRRSFTRGTPRGLFGSIGLIAPSHGR